MDYIISRNAPGGQNLLLLTGVVSSYLVSPEAVAVSEGITHIYECETNHKGPAVDQSTYVTTKRLLVLSTAPSSSLRVNEEQGQEQINQCIGD